MKTTTEIVDQVYREISRSRLVQAISGDMYKYERPVNSKVEDIILSYAGGELGPFQSDVIKCNIYVPCDGSKVNHNRIAELMSLVIPIFDQKAFGMYRYELAENPKIQKVEGIDQYRINVLVRVITNNN